MIRQRVFCLRLLLGLMMLSALSSANASDWGSIFVDYPFPNFFSATGTHSSIAIDSADKVHILYYDDAGSLKYATNSSGNWERSPIEGLGNVGSRSSIAIDSNDVIHISYFDSANLDLKHATNISGEWTVTTVDSLGNVGSNSSIVCDSLDRVHIGYHDTTNKSLKYAVKENGRWASVTLDDNGHTGLGISIASDFTNAIHISYIEDRSVYKNFQLQYNYHLKYITNISGEWVAKTVYSPTQDGEFTFAIPSLASSIAVDRGNFAHISYHQPRLKDLIYVSNSSGSWSVDTLADDGDTGFYPSICIDSGNKVHLSYHDKTNGILKYISNSNGPWVSDTVDDARTSGVFSSMALDSADAVHISHAHSNNKSCFNCGGSHFLKYASNAVPAYQVDDGVWSYSTSDNWVAGHQDCLNQNNETGEVTIQRNGNNITALLDDIRFTGMFDGEHINLSASFPEYPLPDRILPTPNITYLADGLTTYSIDLTATSNLSLSGTVTWSWDFDEALKCNGGSTITLSAISSEPTEVTEEIPESSTGGLSWMMLLLQK